MCAQVTDWSKLSMTPAQRIEALKAVFAAAGLPGRRHSHAIPESVRITLRQLFPNGIA